MHKPISWPALAFVCMVIVIAFFSYRGWMLGQIEEMNEKETVLTVSLARLNAESNDKQDEIERVGTDADIEAKARANYGYMKEGELRFKFNNPEALDEYTDEEKLILEQELTP